MIIHLEERWQGERRESSFYLYIYILTRTCIFCFLPQHLVLLLYPGCLSLSLMSNSAPPSLCYSFPFLSFHRFAQTPPPLTPKTKQNKSKRHVQSSHKTRQTICIPIFIHLPLLSYDETPHLPQLPGLFFFQGTEVCMAIIDPDRA